MKKILITGGAGFVGRHFVRRFLERGDEVHCVDNIAPLTGGFPQMTLGLYLNQGILKTLIFSTRIVGNIFTVFMMMILITLFIWPQWLVDVR